MTHRNRKHRALLAANKRRADWADRAVTAFQIATGADRDDAITDLLGDLMHLCDAEQDAFDARLATARMHYQAELAGE